MENRNSSKHRYFGWLVFAVALILLCLPSQALADIGKTADEGVVWVYSLSEGVGYEFDGYTGYYDDNGNWVYVAPQCVDLIVGYMDCLTGTHTRGNGKDYAWNSLPSGYTRIQKYGGFVPEKGDILIWTTGQWGHVAVVTAVNSSTQIVFTDQNGGLSNRIKHNRTMNPASNDYWGVIRPEFKPAVVYLDVNGLLDGSNDGNLIGDSNNQTYGTFDIYINGQLAGNDVTDYYKADLSYGTTYEIRDIRPSNGKSYDGVTEGNRSGTLNGNAGVRLKFTTIPNSLDITPTVSTFNGHTYYFVSKASTWYAAKYFSEKMGGHLVTITSAAENAFVYQLAGNASLWIGATDQASEGTFKWVNGETLSYTNWNSGEPNNAAGIHNGSEEYVHLTTDGKWNDSLGSSLYPFVCEFDVAYTVSYNANGGTGAPASQTKAYGQNLTLSSTKPSRKGYTFLGWSASSTATSATYSAGGSYTANANATLYAVWKLNNYTVSFEPNGGAVSPANKTVFYGSTYGNLPTPTRVGYGFDGWYTDATGRIRVTSSTIFTAEADQTLYAHWSTLGQLTLPGAMKTIEAQAFMGDDSFSHVVIPTGCTLIGSQAFADCGNLISVRILGNSTMFEDDTFEGSPNVVIYCRSGSKAQRLAIADGLEYYLIDAASDWVPAGNVPPGAQITARKWTYTLREYTESASSSYAGWTKYDAKRTGWTDWSAWQDNAVSASNDRDVETQTVVTGYNMISYCVSGPQGRSYQPSPTYTVRLQHGPYWWSKAEFDAANVFPAGSYFDYASNVAGYVLDGTGYCKWDGSDTGGYVPMFIQDTTSKTQWHYRDAVYTYYYFRDVNKESAANPSGQDHVSNVQEWVKYVY